jgi:RNA polymerase sigma-54 factor
MSYPLSFEFKQKQTQNLKQNQLLMMLPQMQQAISLLQAPVMEISQIIDAEMERNPILEAIEEYGEEENKEREDPEEVTVDHDDFEIMKKLDDEYRDFFEQSGSFQKPTKQDEERKLFLDNSIVASDTLYSHLLNQSHETFDAEKDIEIAELIIGSIDDRGFLETSVDEIAVMGGVSSDEVERVLKEIQTFDPFGVGARSTQESLLIQLKNMGKESSLAYKIIENHYDELLHNKIPAIQKKLGISYEKICRVMDEDIARLDLNPGSWYSIVNESTIVPDAAIREDEGKLALDINDDVIPPLRVNRKYLRMLSQDDLESSTKEYIHQHLMSAKWLIKNILQRNETISRILNYIMKAQKEFFLSPKGELVPMTMRDIAEDLDLHESTIARAVSGKYIDTPRGVLALRSLFTYSYQKQDGSDMSAQTVRDKIKKLIDEENKQNTLSDEMICRELKSMGIDCARRTIAKYRRDLNIGNAQQRRKYS